MRSHFSLPGVGLLLALAACTLVVAACGGADGAESEASGSTGGASSASNEQDAARVRLQECLREQGVDLPAGGPGGGDGGGGEPPDIDRDELQQAMEACAEFRDEAFGDISEQDRQEFQDAFAKFSQCMRDEGIDVPEMNPGEGPPGGGEQLDRDDPDVQAAIEQCQDELPQGGMRPGAGAP
jgi:hypothetical protein